MASDARVAAAAPDTCGILGNRAFTLVELLVVMAIISILCSVLMPALMQARKAARSIACRSNLKQLGLNMSTYVDTWNGYFPTYMAPGWVKSWHYTPCTDGMRSASSKSKATASKSSIFICPEDENIRTVTVGLGGIELSWVPADQRIYYGYSYGLTAGFGSTTGSNRKLSTLRAAASRITMFSDCDDGGDAARVRVDNESDYTGGFPYHDREYYGLNQAFVDGHVSLYLTPAAPFYEPVPW